MEEMFAHGLHTLYHLSNGSEMFAYIVNGGLVMVPLLAISAVMWMLVFERVVAFHRLEFRDITMAELVHDCRDNTPHPGSRYGLRSQLGRFFARRRHGRYPLTRSQLDEYYLKTMPNIDRHIDAITTLAMVCPLLGLLGTVSGMITTFDVIALFGTGHSKALAGGISEALITTQGGLLVAIPGMFASAVLSLKARRLRERLEESIMTLKRIVES
nr:MotA/TolQ/ExbB proton channel family protein [uncultured Desulfuromonas sp.]